MDDVLTRPAAELATMSLAEAPDYLTALAAAEAHGIAPPEALRSAFGKWLTDNHEVIQRYGLANFYDGPEAARAMVNQGAMVRFLAIALADMGKRVARIEDENRELRRMITAPEETYAV